MSNDYPCCNDCGALDALYSKRFSCYLCDECYEATVKEERIDLEEKYKSNLTN